MQFVKDPIELTTAATDALLALAAGAGVCFLYHSQPSAGVNSWRIAIWSAAIGLIGLGAALGAAAHGLAFSPRIHRRIWQALNMSLALAVSFFLAGVACDLWSPHISSLVLPASLVLGFGFYLTTLLKPGMFLLFIIYETLALAFALGAYALLAIRASMPGAGLMAGGIFISMAAAALQARKSLSVTLVWKFDHNGIYHLVQVVGLIFLLAGLHRSTGG